MGPQNCSDFSLITTAIAVIPLMPLNIRVMEKKLYSVSNHMISCIFVLIFSSSLCLDLCYILVPYESSLGVIMLFQKRII